MAVSYKKLRYCLVDEKLTMTKLMRMSRITDNAMRQISKDRDVSSEVLTKVRTALHCEEDIVNFMPDSESQHHDCNTFLNRIEDTMGLRITVACSAE